MRTQQWLPKTTPDSEEEAPSGRRISELAQAARAKSVRLELAPIGLQRVVNEMTLHPRPASLRQTITVETDHPRIQLATR